MPPFETESVSLTAAVGRVLRQAVCAERDQPPFDRVTMDGIAIRYAALASGIRSFTIEGRQHAGDPQQALAGDSSCIEIMTGAVLPANTYCIVPIERTTTANQIVHIDPAYHAARSQFIHCQGSDFRRHHRVLDDGQRIAATDIAVIASCGLDTVRVTKQPRVHVISTGNELVAAGQPLAAHQVRLSNGPAIVAMLQSHGYANNQHDHIVDDRQQLQRKLARHLLESEVLVLSGGVSMGKADFVPQVLRELGINVVFHKVSQRPGKPMWFGVGSDNRVVFALPGNPVSALVCCRQYVLPALAKASGCSPAKKEYARLDASFTMTAALTCFLPIRLYSNPDGCLLATPAPTNTSGDFAALSGTDGYLELAKEMSEFSSGSGWPLHRWDRL